MARRVSHRWRLGALVFAVCAVLTLAVAFLLPSKYESRLKVVVKNERVDPLIGADKQTQGVLYVNEISEARINTEIQLLTSADVLREVVAQSHLVDVVGLSGQPQAKRAAAALQRLQKDLSVSAVRNSNVIEATYESRDPQRAEDVLHHLAQAYMHSHRTVHGVPGSYDFFQNVSAKYSHDLASAEAELAAFGRDHHIVTLSEQKTLALNNISRLQAQMQESAAAERKAARSAAQLKKEMASLPEMVQRQRRTMPNQASIEQLSTLLVTLQNKRTQAAFRYQPEDRFVRELDQQIGQTQDAISTARESTVEEVSTGVNPAMDFARAEYVRTDVEQVGDQAKTEELGRQLSVDQTALTKLDGQSTEYRNLQRRVADLEELDQTYRKRAEEAKLAELLDEQRISNLAIIEEPFREQLPSSPKRGLILAVGLFWSVIFACGSTVGLELLTERIQTPFALEQATGSPVLATVPSNAVAPAFGGSFPALYLSMQRAPVSLEGRLS